MRELRIPGPNGRMILDYNAACPFVADNALEEALLHYLHRINNSLEDQLGAIYGETDNVIECRLIDLEATLSTKLDAVIEELRLMRQGRAM